MNLDVELLTTLLFRAEPEEVFPIGSCNAYLFEHIFWPSANGKPIRLRDIDLSRFEMSDLDDIEIFNDAVYREGQKLGLMAETIKKAIPAACHVRRFC